MTRRGSPTQVALGDVDMTAYGFGDEASRKVRWVGLPAKTVRRGQTATTAFLPCHLQHGRASPPRSPESARKAQSTFQPTTRRLLTGCDEFYAQEFMSGAASDQADQPFCDSLTDYNWQSTDLEGLLRWAHSSPTPPPGQMPGLT